VAHVAGSCGFPVNDYVALAEIELCGELMIAASSADEERLSSARIDEVLDVASECLGLPFAAEVCCPPVRPWRT
jgi:hypothetical protein